jgi:hypothetical protein
MPAPCAIEGGGGLSTICGLGFVKREKKLAHILTDLVVNPYNFLFENGKDTQAREKTSLLWSARHKHVQDIRLVNGDIRQTREE